MNKILTITLAMSLALTFGPAVTGLNDSQAGNKSNVQHVVYTSHEQLNDLCKARTGRESLAGRTGDGRYKSTCKNFDYGGRTAECETVVRGGISCTLFNENKFAGGSDTPPSRFGLTAHSDTGQERTRDASARSFAGHRQTAPVRPAVAPLLERNAPAPLLRGRGSRNVATGAGLPGHAQPTALHNRPSGGLPARQTQRANTSQAVADRQLLSPVRESNPTVAEVVPDF